MKLGISSYTYGWAVGSGNYMPESPMSFMALIERTHEFGLGLLQIGDNLPLDQLPQSELRKGKDALRRYGIELEIGACGLTDGHIEKYVELCKFFSSKLLRIVVDEGTYRPSEEEIIQILKKWAPVLEAAGITIGIENHDRLKVMQLARIMRCVNSPVIGICLDTANSLGALEGVETVLDALIPYTVNLHAKDISVNRLPSKQGFKITGTASGEGMLDFMDLVVRLSLHNQNINCILEQWTPYTGDLKETICNEAQDAVKGVHNLKKIIEEAKRKADKIFLMETIFQYRDIRLQKVKKQRDNCYQILFPNKEAILHWNASAAEKIKEYCNSLGIRIKQVYAGVKEGDEFPSSGWENLLCEKNELISSLIHTVKDISGCDEIVIPLGKLNAVAENLTISQMQQIDENYFLGLAEIARIINSEGFRIGFHLMPDSFVDSSLILMQKMIHNNVSQFKIYSS